MAVEIFYYGKETKNALSQVTLSESEKETLDLIKNAPRMVLDGPQLMVEFFVPADKAKAVYQLIKKLSDAKVIGEENIRFEAPPQGEEYDGNMLSPYSFSKMTSIEDMHGFLMEEAEKNKAKWAEGKYTAANTTFYPGHQTEGHFYQPDFRLSLA